MEPSVSATTSPVTETVITVLVWISELVFQWIPATFSVLLGFDVLGTAGPAATTTPGQPTEPGQPIPLPGTEPLADGGGFGDALGNLGEVWNTIVPFLIFFALILLTGIIYAVIRFAQIREQEEALHTIAEDMATASGSSAAQLRWSRIVEQAHSTNPADWRLAILEADIMLDELLTTQGYMGDTTGEKMKQVARADFNTIDSAWEAHKLRNEIAHQGSARELNPREVKRAIHLYEAVFREFKFI